MSFVLDSYKLRSALYSAMSYAASFYGALDSQALKSANVPIPFFGPKQEDYLNLKADIFLNWLQTEVAPEDWKPQTAAGSPFQTEFFRFTKQFKEDWPPFLWWFFNAPESFLKSAALPQYPQTRRRIVDYDGGPRSIRIKQ